MLVCPVGSGNRWYWSTLLEQHVLCSSVLLSVADCGALAALYLLLFGPPSLSPFHC